MRARRIAAAAVAGGGLAYVRHAAPAVLTITAVRARVRPALAGIGRPDQIALTFDDGPDLASTPAFLSALDDLGWRATFFVLGRMVRNAPGLTAEIAAAGHELAVHGDVHVSHLRRRPGDIAADIARAHDAVVDAAGVQPAWFRPPYGALSAPSLRTAEGLNMRTILWTTWGRDWTEKASPASVVAEVDRRLSPGGCVLLHDSDCTSASGSWRSALGALPLLAERLAERGLKPGPLAEHGVGLG